MKKDFKPKLMISGWKKVCLNRELIVRKEISSDEGLYLTNTLC